MIPYFQFTTIWLGPVPIYVWGLFVASGILAGAALGAWFAKQRGLKPDVIWDLAVWITIGSFIAGRLFQVVFYEPEFYFVNPGEIIKIWHGGMSIIGGFIGAVIAGVWYLWRKKLDVVAYCDTAIFGLPLGMGIGRIGCFLIHDHPGTLTDFVLGVRYPDGVRHDLGLYESLVGFALAVVFYVLWRKKAPQGTYIAVFLIGYGASRFFLDFLRATDGAIVDTRYFGLTPAQYVALAMVGFGLWSTRHLLYRSPK